ncbi:MAG: HAMP domain-containing histidine kinase [Clostridia bacterium]|nr:HAMP domain-containing histidine kinase [Clostridia bacterium]
MKRIKVPKVQTGDIKKKFGISWYLSLLVTGELFVALALATFLSSWFSDIFTELLHIPLEAWIIIFGLIIGSTLAFVLNRLLLFPIRQLDEAMEEVAKGNFKIRLDERSHYRDIEHIYKNFNLMTRELEANEMLKSDFISNVSHEIKTPITAIEGYAMLLQDSADRSSDDAKYVEKILLNTGRLSELVGNILLLSKLDNQNIDSKAEEFSLDEQIRQSIVLLEPKWEKKSLDFDVELEEVTYRATPGIMMHVWNNLIGNAVKFTPEGSTVRIFLKAKSDNITFTVEDCGPGIDEDAKARIFDKFYQCDSSHKSEGNGLGLALVKRILDIYGGEITTENLPEGCRFTVTLPKK